MDVLPIFPFESSAITVTTTVWIGVLVCVVFNLRFGWTLSGLVVPGYLVPLMMTRPLSVAVIVVEAIVTYFLAYAISELPRKTPYWCSFFGRDRFFVIMILSVVVRAFFDSFLLECVGDFLVHQLSVDAALADGLHSFGLIVVALIANYLWKPGVVRGIPPMATCLFLTYAIVCWVLVPYTNFGIGNIHSLYEDITTSLLSSPKSYIILIVTAYIASLVNLLYAWDFNGILMPALLGLLWYDPIKILASGLECVLVWKLSAALLKLRLFQKMTIQGARKTLFFFTVCFLYRLLASHLVPIAFPELQVTDVFGFGYLLSTLMAIKINDKKHSLRMLRGTAEVSLIGAVAGSVIGFALFWHSGDQVTDNGIVANQVKVQSSEPQLLGNDINRILLRDKVLLYEVQQRRKYKPPTDEQTRTFAVCMKRLSETDPKNQRAILELGNQLQQINFQLSVVGQRYFYVREQSPANGWGLYLLDSSSADSGLTITCPAPLNEPGSMESAMFLFHRFKARALAIAGAPRWLGGSDKPDVTRPSNTTFGAFCNVLSEQGSVHVRGYSSATVNRINATQSPDDQATTDDARLYVNGSIPSSLNLADLQSLTGKLDVNWQESPTDNALVNQATSNTVELLLPKKIRHELRVKLAAMNRPEPVLPMQEIAFQNWMVGIKQSILKRSTNFFQPATIQEILYMDREVVGPLIQALNGPQGEQISELRSRLMPVDAAARSIGYQIALIDDFELGEVFVALCEVQSETPRGWGTFVFRPGLRSAFAIEVPRPLLELRSFAFGLSLFQRPKSTVLMIAGAHPHANDDGAADISSAANRKNLFNLVRHVLLRNFPDRPLLLVQSRAIAAPVTADVMVATDDGTTEFSDLSPLKSLFVNQLRKDLNVEFVKGQVDAAGYELGILMQAMAVQISQNKEVISLWLSPSLRKRFREQSENVSLLAKFQAIRLPIHQEGLVSHVQREYLGEQGWKTDPVLQDLRQSIGLFLVTQDIIQLRAIENRFPDFGFELVVDGIGGQAYLIVRPVAGGLPIIVNLTGTIQDEVIMYSDMDLPAVRRFITSRSRWLIPVPAVVEGGTQ